MAANLSLPHKPQKGDGYCLPACVQMVLAHLGIFRSQDSIGKTLGLNPPFGTRHSNIRKLASRTIKVTYEAGTLEDIRGWLNQNVPIIVFIQAGELSHWSGYHFQHAVVVVGIEGHICYGSSSRHWSYTWRSGSVHVGLEWNGLLLRYPDPLSIKKSQ